MSFCKCNLFRHMTNCGYDLFYIWHLGLLCFVDVLSQYFVIFKIHDQNWNSTNLVSRSILRHQSTRRQWSVNSHKWNWLVTVFHLIRKIGSSGQFCMTNLTFYKLVIFIKFCKTIHVTVRHKDQFGVTIFSRSSP